MPGFDDTFGLTRPAEPNSDVADDTWDSPDIPEASFPLLTNEDPSVVRQAIKPGMRWPGNTLVSAGSVELEGSLAENISVFEDPVVMEIDVLQNIGSELQEPSWALKCDVQPISPLTPQSRTSPRSPLLLNEEPSRSLSKMTDVIFDFPEDANLKNSVLPTLMSPMESETVSSVGNLHRNDIIPSNPLLSESTATTFKQEKETTPAPPTTGGCIEISAEVHVANSTAQIQQDPRREGNQAAQEFLDSLAELDFHFDGSSLQEGTQKVCGSLDNNALLPISTSSREVMARAAAAVASGKWDDRERQWACELCFSRFSIKGHLSQHLRYVHEKYRPHRCPVTECDASFGTRFARSQHIWTVHENLKPFRCDYPHCKSSFGQRSHLNRHRKRHPGSKGARRSQGALRFKEGECLIKGDEVTISPTLVAAAAASSVTRLASAAVSSHPRNTSAAVAGNMVNHVASNVFGPLPPFSIGN